MSCVLILLFPGLHSLIVSLAHLGFLARYEAFQGELVSSHASEYSDVWYSFLAPRDLHVGLKSCSKLLPSTEVYSPQYIMHQFGLVQAISAQAKFFTANTTVNRLLTKNIEESDWISAMGSRLQRFFKLVSFRSNCTGVVFFRYTVTWDQFTDRVFDLSMHRAHRQTIRPFGKSFANYCNHSSLIWLLLFFLPYKAICFPSKDFLVDTVAPSVPREELEENSDHNFDAPPSFFVVNSTFFVSIFFPLYTYF